LERRQTARHPRKIPALKGLWRWVRFRFIIPVFRSPHSAEFTARGVANGVFWGLTPTIGLQTFAIVATWFITKRLLGTDSSLVQALLWVWINNPVTMVPMYYAFYVTGLWLSGTAVPATGYESFLALWDRPELGWLERVTAIGRAVGVPLMIGCIPYAALGAGLSYRWALVVIRRRRHRLRRRAASAHG
jgi:uncharacterized protein (DUF2062 family)